MLQISSTSKLDHQILPDICFGLNSPKGIAKTSAVPVDLLGPNMILRSSKPSFLTPEKYDDHPCFYIRVPPSPGINVKLGRDKLWRKKSKLVFLDLLRAFFFGGERVGADGLVKLSVQNVFRAKGDKNTLLNFMNFCSKCRKLALNIQNLFPNKNSMF